MIFSLGLIVTLLNSTQSWLKCQNNFKCLLIICHADEVMSMDQRLLKIILENHILRFKVSLNELYNGQLLETLGGKLLRVFIYRTVRDKDSYCFCLRERDLEKD